jgi:hypothetical protein
MSDFSFLIAVDRSYDYHKKCPACASGIVFDNDAAHIEKDGRCWCDYLCEDDYKCDCPAYYHRFTFTQGESNSTHLKIETNVENKGARRTIIRFSDSVEFDFTPSCDDTDITIFTPHIPMLRLLFIDRKINESMVNIIGQLRAKRITLEVATTQLKIINDEIVARITAMFSRKSMELRKDIRWITPMAKTLARAILAHAMPLVEDNKGCVHIGSKKKKY